MKVLIADDEAVVLEGLKYIIDWEALGFSICSQAKNGNETLEKLLKLSPDLVLLDIRMPGLTGIEIVQIARERASPDILSFSAATLIFPMPRLPSNMELIFISQSQLMRTNWKMP